jgi:type IV pilus assembly protein PilM
MAQKAVIGLDMGTDMIKFVEIRAGRTALELVHLGLAPTPRETISNGVIVNPETLGAAVRDLLSSQGVRTRAVVSSVAGQSSLVVRPIEVPRMTRQELADTMRWEVERHIPFAASEVIMDFQPMIAPEDLPPDAQNMDVLLAVAQEDMINAHVQTLLVANLEPTVIDVEPLSAARALVDINADQGAYDQVIALVNVGATTTDISIIRSGLLSFTRPIPLAGDSITNAISENLGVEIERAEQLKREEGRVFVEGATPALPSPPASGGPAAPAPAAAAPPAPAPTPAPASAPAEDEEAVARPVFDLSSELEEETTPKRPVFDLSASEETPAPPSPPPASGGPTLPSPTSPAGETGARRVYQAMLPTLTELVTEIRRSVEYYGTRSGGATVDRILLFGGTSLLPDLDQFLSREIGIPVHIPNTFERLLVTNPNYSEEYLASVGRLFPVAVGLAIRDMIG